MGGSRPRREAPAAPLSDHREDARPGGLWDARPHAVPPQPRVLEVHRQPRHVRQHDVRAGAVRPVCVGLERSGERLPRDVLGDARTDRAGRHRGDRGYGHQEVSGWHGLHRGARAQEAGADYVIGTRNGISNKTPIIGAYDVNKSGSGDMYSKGANMLHTIRMIIDNDEKWRAILRGLNKEFYHSTVTTGEIENYISDQADIDLSKIFDQYLRNANLPEFDYSIDGTKLTYKWKGTVAGFDMPMIVQVNDKAVRLTPTTATQTYTSPDQIVKLTLDQNFYINGKANFDQINQIIPNIEYDIRYFSKDNFVGARVDGYLAPIAFITKEAGAALIKVQEELNRDGLGLKIFDAYRPQKGVDHFVRWGKVAEDTVTKSKYYPNINKANVFELGYVATKSGHSRGSTVDLTIIDLQTKVEMDMGSPWDFFGEISHHDSPLVNAQHTANRNKLLSIMLKHGFKQYDNEWWHYTLMDEPFPDTYFDFDVK